MTGSAGPRAKILFVMPNFAGGGAERVALTLLDRLDRARFDPQLVVLVGKGPLRPLLSADVVLHDLARPRLSRALPTLIGLIRRQRPAVVFASQGYLNVVLLALRFLMPAGTCLTLRESNTPSQSLPNRRHPRFMAWAYRRFYPRADLLFCQHRQTEKEFREDFGVPAARIVSLPNPVPEAALRSAAAQPFRPAAPGRHFVAAGRLDRQKGFDRLIALFAGLPDDCRLAIYGEGRGRKDLLRQIGELRLQGRVTLAGFSDRLPAALAGADACVISSRWEGLPNVALEALAVGTRVIAAEESGGIAELAETAAPGAVTVVPWGDAFAAAIAACSARQPAQPAPSLLPVHYRLESVAAIFNAELAKLTEAPPAVSTPKGQP